MEDLIKDLVDRLLVTSRDIYEIKEDGYRNQIESLHNKILKQQDLIQEQRKVILEFKEELRELRKGITEHGEDCR